MGRGDIKTRRGKISNGSFGASRPRKKNETLVAKPKKKTKPKAEAKKAAPKKGTDK